MRLHYDEEFLEAVVLLCANTGRRAIPALQIARYHREREKLYDILDPDDRNTAFFQLHGEWFREWGLQEALVGPLREFPLLPPSLNLLAFRKANGRNDEGAELYVNEAGERNGVVALRPERLVRESDRGSFLRHELMHLQDMVDPKFEYRPELPATGLSPNKRRLAHERYRLLWNITIDGRLSRTGRETVAGKHQRSLEFANAFASWTETKQHEVFESLWSHPFPNHQRLVELLSEQGELQPNEEPQPGNPCPLCGFPTFAWADQTSMPPATVIAIRTEFPGWVPEHGACARCSEVYRHKLAPAPIVI
jgi:hypothetical protein